MKKQFFFILAILLGNILQAQPIKMPAIFGNNMVLQRNQPIKIWGQAKPGAIINISFANSTISTTTKADSQFIATLPAQNEGGSFELIVSSGTEKLQFKNIAMGDVWLCGGQSNMEWDLKSSQIYTNDIKKSGNSNIRLIKVNNSASANKQKDFYSNGWQLADSNNTANFSAVAYFFAREINAKYNIPIGLISSNWGGTDIGYWMSTEALSQYPNILNNYKELSTLFPEKVADQNRRVEKLNDWKQIAIKNDLGTTENWEKLNFPLTNWNDMPIPITWENKGLPDFDGVVWFCKEINIDKPADINLNLGFIDDMDITYFNGVEIGRTDDYTKFRKYNIPAKLVKKGKNTIAVKVIDYGGGGGFTSDKISFDINNENTSLNGDWKYKIGYNYIKQLSEYVLPDWSFMNNWQPAELFNAMINPLLNFPIKGVIWYQGEANAEKAYDYRTLMPTLINDWRKNWNCGEFPFLLVQLANFQPAYDVPTESNWAELREAQLFTLHTPNTAMAVTIDIGEANNIHPKNKLDVGKRLALAAQHIAYNDTNLEYSGPIYNSMAIEGNSIRLKFKHIGKGLVVKGEQLNEFAIAGDDKKFVWATAKIDGNDIVVSNSTIKQPVAVRYAWANNPEKANLYNSENLPASPFRTDDWPGLTYKK